MGNRAGSSPVSRIKEKLLYGSVGTQLFLLEKTAGLIINKGMVLFGIASRDFTDMYRTIPEAVEKMYYAGRADGETLRKGGTIMSNAAKTQQNTEVLSENSSKDKVRASGMDGFITGESVQGSREERIRLQTERRTELKNLSETEGYQRRKVSDLYQETGRYKGTGSEITIVLASYLKGHESTRKSVAKLASEGIKVTMFLGNASLKDKQYDYDFDVRGWLSEDGKEIFVRADHPEWTAEQIMDHEYFHKMKRKVPGLMDTIREKLSGVSDEELHDLADKYAEVYGISGCSFEYIMEEIYADIYAGMDTFAGKADSMRKYGKAVEEGVKESKAAGNETRGPPRHSINERFYTDIEKWDEKDSSLTFRIGRTSEALKSIKIPDKAIIMHSKK